MSHVITDLTSMCAPIDCKRFYNLAFWLSEHGICKYHYIPHLTVEAIMYAMRENENNPNFTLDYVQHVMV